VQQRRLVGVLSTLAVLGLPAVAHGATRTVFMGTPPSAQKAFGKLGVDANQFFPASLTVHVGDTVKFAPVGFHSLDLPPKGDQPLPLAGATGKTLAGQTDAAGVPFWFNGLPEVGFTSDLLASAFGKSFKAPSAKRIESGLPLGNKLKPVSVKFTKAGTYTYYCNVHAGMVGKVNVVAARKLAPTTKAVGLAVNRQVKADKAIATGLPSIKPAADTVLMGPEKGGMVLFAFSPQRLAVKPGTTVTFTMPTVAREAHSATFGPGDPSNEKVKSYLGDLAATIATPAFAGAASYPSDPPTVTASLSPTLHGNGFWNTGLLDSVAASPLPSSGKVRFDTPGTYDYYCLIHTNMHGQVIVG
jgi:plastocyanin